jgi:8-oxo-dGTP pyrophosphatase MutT (NUDIX family)
MSREGLLQELAGYRPADEAECRMLERMRSFVASNPDCFSPALRVGHITGGAWILDRSHHFVLLTHHLKLDKWLHLGGHADGETDGLAIALREAHEESGLTDIRPLSGGIFDLDVHPIPARGDQPAHEHYDLRYLLEADRSAPLVVSSESKALAWVKLAEIHAYTTETSIMRMVAKSPQPAV